MGEGRKVGEEGGDVHQTGPQVQGDEGSWMGRAVEEVFGVVVRGKALGACRAGSGPDACLVGVEVGTEA